MPLTTKDEQPTREVPEINDIEAQIKDLYNKGANLYVIAKKVYGFDSEEAVKRVADILAIFDPIQSQVVEG